MPSHVKLSGERFEFTLPNFQALPLVCWRPPSPGSVSYERISSRSNGKNETYSWYRTWAQIRQLGSKHFKSIEVAYRTEQLAPELI